MTPSMRRIPSTSPQWPTSHGLVTSSSLDFAQSHGHPAIDVAASLEPTLDNFYDDVHFNTLGAQRFAHCVAEDYDDPSAAPLALASCRGPVDAPDLAVGNGSAWFTVGWRAIYRKHKPLPFMRLDTEAELESCLEGTVPVGPDEDMGPG